jgi:hypothetical protein
MLESPNIENSKYMCIKTVSSIASLSTRYINYIRYWGCRGHDCMVVGFTTPMQSVPITTKVVSSNPVRARCTQ